MKKTLILIMLLCGVVCARASDGDNISGVLEVASDKSNATLHVNLTNDLNYIAFQMDITLPDGWTVTNIVPVASSRLDGSGDGTTIGDTRFNLLHKTLDGNKVRVLAFNLANDVIKGNKGEQIMAVEISKSGEPAESVTSWTATFSNVLFVSKDATTDALTEVVMPVGNTNSTVIGKSSFLLGDVDEDGIIDVQDVLRTAQLVLNSSYNIAADMDEDKLIDVQDVIMVAKAVLEQDVVSSASKSAAKAMYKNSLADNISLCSPANGTIDVKLNNKEEYHGFQMDVELPVGYSFTQDANGDAEISINDRKLSGFSVMQKMYSDSKMRILVFNDSQNAIPQNVGELFRFKIKKDNTTIGDVCDVRISNVIFSHDTGKVILSGQVKSFEISDVTGINSVTEKMPKQDVYTVNGKRVKTPIKNSIYIVNGKKSICK